MVRRPKLRFTMLEPENLVRNLHVVVSVCLLFLIFMFVFILPPGDTGDPLDVWTGPLMPGKALPAPEKPPWAVQRSLAVKNSKPKDKPVTQRSTLEGDKEQGTKDPQENEEGRFLVEAGTFVLKIGADSLVERLRTHGINARLETSREMVTLNNVQAGPYAKLEDAKEAELKLKAAGNDGHRKIGSNVRVEETWEGYVISLGKFYLLGYAVEALEEAQKLNITELHMTKVEADLSVQKVVVGPYLTHEAAKNMSSRIARLGLAIPVIRERNPNAPPPAKVEETGKETP